MDYLRVVLEFVFIAWTVAQTIKTMKLCLRNPLWFWRKFFNVINVVAYTNLTASFAMWAYIVGAGLAWSPVAPTIPLSDAEWDAVKSESLGLHQMALVQRVYSWSNVLAMVLLVMRWITHLSFHRRLAIVTTTIYHAATDLLHFVVPFSIIISCYAFMAWTLIGRQNDDFSTFERSFVSLSLVALGDFALFSSIEDIEKEIGPLFFLSYVIIVTVLMINIVLAIVVDAFMSSANSKSSKKSDRSTLFDDVLLVT